MSTIQELCKRLLSRRPNLEPILSKQLLQLGTNLVVETSGSISNDSSVMSTVIAKLRKIAVLMLRRSPTAKTAGKQKIRGKVTSPRKTRGVKKVAVRDE